MTTRVASHAGSWYSADTGTLQRELDSWTDDVDKSLPAIGEIPQSSARVIIAPHAGYAYSGPTAAWAYQSLDVTKTKRVFLLGPSHQKYLTTCALSTHNHYATPLGNISLDLETIGKLRDTGKFPNMDLHTDEAEHSLEMHLPYIYYTLVKKSDTPIPPLIPILVGATSSATEKMYGSLLAPYLADPTSLFVISSDFCHWGSRFNYTYYLSSANSAIDSGTHLGKRESVKGPPVYKTIERIDRAAMDAIETGSHESFRRNLAETGNTVCGQHPIGVIMATIEHLKAADHLATDKGLFRFIRYDRSSEVRDVRESSVSYCSAFAVV